MQHQHRGVRQIEAALQQAAARADAAEQDRHRDDRERMLAREERDQDAGVAVAGDERGVGAAVHRRDLGHAREAGGAAAETQVTITIMRRTGRPGHEGGARRYRR